MAEDGNEYFTVTTPIVMIYPNLVVPKSFKDSKGADRGEPKYSGEFLFTLDDQQVADLKGGAASVARAKWPGVDLKSLATPWKKGDVLADKNAAKARAKGKEPYAQDEAGRGKWRIAARSKYQPTLSILQGGKVIELTDEASIKKFEKTFFYPGVLVLPQFKIVAYTGVRDGDPDGLNLYLQQVFSLGKGDKLGNSGGPSAADTFSGYVGSFSGVDPTGGGSQQDDNDF